MPPLNTRSYFSHSDVQQNFGLLNDGRVYALYTYIADEEDELSFECGEELLVLTRGDATEKEWWWAENKDGETGYIPRNLLGVSEIFSWSTFFLLLLFFFFVLFFFCFEHTLVNTCSQQFCLLPVEDFNHVTFDLGCLFVII